MLVPCSLERGAWREMTATDTLFPCRCVQPHSCATMMNHPGDSLLPWFVGRTGIVWVNLWWAAQNFSFALERTMIYPGKKNSYISSLLKVSDCYFDWLTGSYTLLIWDWIWDQSHHLLLTYTSLSSLAGCAEHPESLGGLLELCFRGDLMKQVAGNSKLWCLGASALTLW